MSLIWSGAESRPGDVPGRLRPLVEPDDQRARVAQQPHEAVRRPDLDDRADEGAAIGEDRIPELDARVAAAVERHHTLELGRLAADDLGEHRLVLHRALRFEQPGEALVLLGEGLELRDLLGELVDLAPERAVLEAEPVDLRERAEDRGE
jgi:hypothetical protein